MEFLIKMIFFVLPRYGHTGSFYPVAHSTHTLLLICSPTKMRTRRTANGCSTCESAVFGSQSPLQTNRNVDSDANSPAEFGGRKSLRFSWRCILCTSTNKKLQSKALTTEHILLFLMDSSLYGTAFINLFWAQFSRDAKYQICL